MWALIWSSYFTSFWVFILKYILITNKIHINFNITYYIDNIKTKHVLKISSTKCKNTLKETHPLQKQEENPKHLMNVSPT